MQTRLFSPGFHRLLFIVIVVNARSLSSFTLFDTFANSISRFNPISANFNSLPEIMARFLPEIKVGTISARDYLWQSLQYEFVENMLRQKSLAQIIVPEIKGGTISARD
jgi:hypothetical protein